MRIADILTPERIALDAEIGAKQDVLARLATMLAADDPALDAATVLDGLLARERLGTTGVGAGIAIPHGRASHASKVIGAFLRTRRPITFDAADNAPVDLFFALCVPPGATAEHLALLSELAHLFNEVPLAKSLRLAASNSETYALLTRGEPDA